MTRGSIRIKEPTVLYEWIKLIAYRFRISNAELLQCQKDRRSMDEIRRNLIDADRRMKLYEESGGSCQENGGLGVPVTIQGRRFYLFRNAVSTDTTSKTKTNNVIDITRSINDRNIR